MKIFNINEYLELNQIINYLLFNNPKKTIYFQVRHKTKKQHFINGFSLTKVILLH